jgi:hypothetical protein
MNQDVEQTPVGMSATEPARPSPAAAERRERLVEDPRRKSVWMAAVLSLMPGLGQVYVGYYQQGFINIVAIAGMIAIIESGSVDQGLEALFGLLIAFGWMFNVVDAARRASLYNQALSGLRQMDLPEDVKAPRRLGSLGGGIGLIGIGLVFFSHTVFGLSLGWIADWWPMAIVAAGAWLVYEDRRGKRANRAAECDGDAR